MSDTQASRKDTAHNANLEKTAELFNIDEHLQEELQRLAAINRELLGEAQPHVPAGSSRNRHDKTASSAVSGRGGVAKGPPGLIPADAIPAESDELTHLRRENEELRAHLDALEKALEAPEETAAPASPVPEENPWAAKQQEYEALLEEKSEAIRALHLKLHELQSRAGATSESTPREDARSLKRQLEHERVQIEKDEEELMIRMTQLEKAISKDRAELARQRTEIQRLHQELNEQIAAASRDPGMSDRQDALYRLQGEVEAQKHAKGAGSAGGKKSSGLLGRIFKK
jgi:hypothetical protein